MIVMKHRDDLYVLLLCGGKGERLKPLTDSIPKPLIPIKGKPIVYYLIAHLEKAGFRNFVVSIGYKAEKMREYFRVHHTHLNIQLVDSGDVDIVRRIQGAQEVIPGDYVMCYGDTLADVNMDGLLAFHEAHQGLLTMTSYPLRSQFGVLELTADGKVTSFLEKPILDKWINIGYYYFDQKIRASVYAYHDFVDFLQACISSQRLYCYKHTGVHITVNTLKELDEAEDSIQTLNVG